MPGTRRARVRRQENRLQQVTRRRRRAQLMIFASGSTPCASVSTTTSRAAPATNQPRHQPAISNSAGARRWFPRGKPSIRGRSVATRHARPSDVKLGAEFTAASSSTRTGSRLTDTPLRHRRSLDHSGFARNPRCATVEPDGRLRPGQLGGATRLRGSNLGLRTNIDTSKTRHVSRSTNLNRLRLERSQQRRGLDDVQLSARRDVVSYARLRALRNRDPSLPETSMNEPPLRRRRVRTCAQLPGIHRGARRQVVDFVTAGGARSLYLVDNAYDTLSSDGRRQSTSSCVHNLSTTSSHQPTRTYEQAQ